MLDLDVLLAGRLPLPADCLERRHDHLGPGRDQAVFRDRGEQQFVQGGGVQTQGGPRDPPALLSYVAQLQAAARPAPAPGGSTSSRVGVSGPGRRRTLFTAREPCRLGRWQPGRRQGAHPFQPRQVRRRPAPVPSVDVRVRPQPVPAVPRADRGGRHPQTPGHLAGGQSATARTAVVDRLVAVSRVRVHMPTIRRTNDACCLRRFLTQHWDHAHGSHAG